MSFPNEVPESGTFIEHPPRLGIEIDIRWISF